MTEGATRLSVGEPEAVAQTIQAYTNVLLGKLRRLEAYLLDDEDSKYERVEAKDIVEDVVLDLQLCVGYVDRIEEIVRKIK